MHDELMQNPIVGIIQGRQTDRNDPSGNINPNGASHTGSLRVNPDIRHSRRLEVRWLDGQGYNPEYLRMYSDDMQKLQDGQG
jgi:hypothetical protein